MKMVAGSNPALTTNYKQFKNKFIMNNGKKLGLDSAFPVSNPNTALAMFNAGIDPTGMSKRFYAACMAMQGLITTGIATEQGIYNPPIGKMAFEIADDLLKTEQL